MYRFRRNNGGIKKIRKERIELFHECMSSLLLSKPGSSLVRNYAPPDTFQFPVTDLTTPTRKRFNRHLIRARVWKHPRFFHASSSLPRIFEEREGVERWNGNHLRRQRFDEWEGGLNKQLVIRPPHIYGNKGTSRKLARGRVFGFFRVQPRNSIRFMISKRDHKLFDVPGSIFRGKTKEWKISIGDSVRGIIGIWSIFLDSFGYLENLCHVSSSIVLLSYCILIKMI